MLVCLGGLFIGLFEISLVPTLLEKRWSPGSPDVLFSVPSLDAFYFLNIDSVSSFSLPLHIYLAFIPIKTKCHIYVKPRIIVKQTHSDWEITSYAYYIFWWRNNIRKSVYDA